MVARMEQQTRSWRRLSPKLRFTARLIWIRIGARAIAKRWNELSIIVRMKQFNAYLLVRWFRKRQRWEDHSANTRGPRPFGPRRNKLLRSMGTRLAWWPADKDYRKCASSCILQASTNICLSSSENWFQYNLWQENFPSGPTQYKRKMDMAMQHQSPRHYERRDKRGIGVDSKAPGWNAISSMHASWLLELTQYSI